MHNYSGQVPIRNAFMSTNVRRSETRLCGTMSGTTRQHQHVESKVRWSTHKRAKDQSLAEHAQSRSSSDGRCSIQIAESAEQYHLYYGFESGRKLLVR